jgi:hypothetical protein
MEGNMDTLKQAQQRLAEDTAQMNSVDPERLAIMRGRTWVNRSAAGDASITYYLPAEIEIDDVSHRNGQYVSLKNGDVILAPSTTSPMAYQDFIYESTERRIPARVVAEALSVTMGRVRQMAIDLGLGEKLGRERYFSFPELERLRNRPDRRRK